MSLCEMDFRHKNLSCFFYISYIRLYIQKGLLETFVPLPLLYFLKILKVRLIYNTSVLNWISLSVNTVTYALTKVSQAQKLS